jgi:hypothetical protein
MAQSLLANNAFGILVFVLTDRCRDLADIEIAGMVADAPC